MLRKLVCGKKKKNHKYTNTHKLELISKFRKVAGCKVNILKK